MFIKRVLVAPGPLRAARKCFKSAGEEVAWGIVEPFLCGRADLFVVFLGLAGTAEAPLAVVVMAEMLLSAVADSAGVSEVTCFLLGACSLSLPVDGGISFASSGGSQRLHILFLFSGELRQIDILPA